MWQRLIGLLAHHDHVVERHTCSELLGQRHQRLVDNQHHVAGMPGDVRELVDVQPEIQRVQDGARTRNTEVRLQVTQVIPAQRRHPVAATDAELLERGSKPAGPA